MPHTITYEGDATVALDAVLADIASDGLPGTGGWFVEVTTNDSDPAGARTVQGWVEEFLPGSRSEWARVVIAEAVEGSPDQPTGTRHTIPTNHIAHLTVP